MILRPKFVFVDNKWEAGQEIELADDGSFVSLRATSQPDDGTFVSPSFVNAHSHFEYFGLADLIPKDLEFFPWIRRLTELKTLQSPEDVTEDCHLAAAANRRTGVALVGEHSDRPGSAAAMDAHQLGGTIFQEVITFNERERPQDKISLVEQRASEQSNVFNGNVVANPHSLYTVDEDTLRYLFSSPGQRSIHVAESIYENQLIERAEGPFADLERRFGFESKARNMRAIAYLGEVGGLRPETQIVHACDINEAEIAMIADSGASVAHCPRSNIRLQTPSCPVMELLAAGVSVGLGLDSAASSGPISMFDEMRAAFQVASERRHPLSRSQIWMMATSFGAASLGFDHWGLHTAPLISIRSDATSPDEMFDRAQVDSVAWIATKPSQKL